MKQVGRAWAALVSMGGLSSVVAAVRLDRRPVRADRQRRRGQPLELPGPVHHLAADDRQHRLDPLDLLLGDGEIVRRQHREVRQLADLDGALLVLLAREPRAAHGVAAQRFRAVQPVRLGVQRRAADRLARDQPVQRHPRVVAGHAGRVGPRPDRHAHRQHPADRRRVFRRLLAVAVDEVFALEGHAVLDGDAAAQRLDPLEVPLGDRLGVVEEPAQAVERHVPVDRLEHVRGSG